MLNQAVSNIHNHLKVNVGLKKISKPSSKRRNTTAVSTMGTEGAEAPQLSMITLDDT